MTKTKKPTPKATPKKKSASPKPTKLSLVKKRSVISEAKPKVKASTRKATPTKKLSSAASSKFDFEDILNTYEDMKADIIEDIGDIVENSLSSKRSSSAKGKATAAQTKVMSGLDDKLYEIDVNTTYIKDTLDNFIKKSAPKKNTKADRDTQINMADSIALALAKLSKKKVTRNKVADAVTDALGVNGRTKSVTKQARPKDRGMNRSRTWRSRTPDPYDDGFYGYSSSPGDPFELLADSIRHMTAVRGRQAEADRDQVTSTAAKDINKQNRTLPKLWKKPDPATGSSGGGLMDNIVDWFRRSKVPNRGTGGGVPDGKAPKDKPKVPKPPKIVIPPIIFKALKMGGLASIPFLFTTSTASDDDIERNHQNLINIKKLETKYSKGLVDRIKTKLGRKIATDLDSASTVEQEIQKYLDEQRYKKRGDALPNLQSELKAIQTKISQQVKRSKSPEMLDIILAPLKEKENQIIEEIKANGGTAEPIQSKASKSSTPIESLPAFQKLPTKGQEVIKKSLTDRDYMTDMIKPHNVTKSPSNKGKDTLVPIIDAKNDLSNIRKVKVTIRNRKNIQELIYLLGELSKVQDKITRTLQNSKIPEMVQTLIAPMKDEEYRLIQEITTLKTKMLMGYGGNKKSGDFIGGGSGSNNLSGSAGSDILSSSMRMPGLSGPQASFLPDISGPRSFSGWTGGPGGSDTTGPRTASLGPSGGSVGDYGSGSVRSPGTTDDSPTSPPYTMIGGPQAGATVGSMITGGVGPKVTDKTGTGASPFLGKNGSRTPVSFSSKRFAAESGITQGEYMAMKEGIASIENARYNQMGGSSNRFAGRYQMGSAEIRETAKTLGVPVPSREQFLANPEMQEQFFEIYTLNHHKQLMKNPKYRNMSAQDKLAVLGYAHNQGAGGASKWLKTGQSGRDAFGTDGIKYASTIKNRLSTLTTTDNQTASSVPLNRQDGSKITAVKKNKTLKTRVTNGNLEQYWEDKGSPAPRAETLSPGNRQIYNKDKVSSLEGTPDKGMSPGNRQIHNPDGSSSPVFNMKPKEPAATPVKPTPQPLAVMGTESVPSSYRKATSKAKNLEDTITPATNSQGLIAPWFG